MSHAVDLTVRLVRAASVTPEAGEALDVVEDELSRLGADCTRLTFSAPGTPNVDNLFASIGTPTSGTNGPTLTFAGHVDVVPTGPADAWTYPPFSAEIVDGVIYGRGATDMKSGVAAFIAATARYIRTFGRPNGTISFAITGDEEGPSVNGTEKLLAWMLEHGHKPDMCIVGEPASAEMVGDRIRIGRRGSINGSIAVTGKQGHTAYPDLAQNAVANLARIIAAVTAEPVDDGFPGFPASNLEFTSISTTNTATNVIPGDASAKFNIRFNPSQDSESLKAQISARASAVAAPDTFSIELDERHARPFVTEDTDFLDLIDGATQACVGITPERSTGGGTSDARFLGPVCPTVEMGLCAKTMHEVDERVPISDIQQLETLYFQVLSDVFPASSATSDVA